MIDPRVTKLARVLVQYSFKLKEGDLSRIQAEAASAPLVRELYREALLAGAYPLLRISVDGIEELLYKHASDAQLRYIPDLLRQEIEQVTASLYIMGGENTKNLSRSDPQKVALHRQSAQPLNERFLERTAAGELRWGVTLFPTQ